ncbi:MAG: T9SS type A sorting domain-containing protein [Candidatus Latescibacteria bacterium]|nr:T9SS type A sorting domain-containing protein [Candidatus Latescibacterota bacterium]NIO28373.1 T9SS type A sorting domain-containing protein [Candidatus Latescibacterota bacterium]NIO55922.1 T9SS type A sorting domain-containing protein [Candidatus Latescibacterota bacterium]NIT01886.1 T9SS type A sorting domain-containing protein [Candidatus Latescibacterota bacterium]
MGKKLHGKNANIHHRQGVFTMLRYRTAIAIFFVSICILLLADAGDAFYVSSTVDVEERSITTVNCGKLFGLRVLFDGSRGQDLSEWSTFIADLTSEGAIVTENTQSIDDTVLSDIDVLWLTAMTQPFSGDVLSTISNWIENGGRVLMAADDDLTAVEFENLLDQVASDGTGITFRTTDGTAGVSVFIGTHPTTEGIDAFRIDSPSTTLSITSPATVLAWDLGLKHIIGASQLGDTRIIALGDRFFANYEILHADNRRFGFQVFEWFGEDLQVGLPDLSVSPSSIDVTLAPGESTTVSIQITNPAECVVDYEIFWSGSPTFLEPPIFSDDFEDGDFAEWTDSGGSGTKEVTTDVAANGTTWSYHEYGSSQGWFDGIYRKIGSLQPNYISFWVRSASRIISDGYFVILDTEGRMAIKFIMTSWATFCLNNNGMGDCFSFPYDADRWYQISLANINFTTQRLDWYINNILKQSGVYFEDWPLVENFDEVHLFNYELGGEAWWDEIFFWDGNPIEWLATSANHGSVTAGTEVFDVVICASSLKDSTYAGSVQIEGNAANAPVVIPIQLTVSSLSAVEKKKVPPTVLLEQNWPNPFKPVTTIAYEIPSATHARLAIFDVTGKMIRVLVDRPLPAGRFTATWDGTDSHGDLVASGVYFYRLDASSSTQTKKMVLLK